MCGAGSALPGRLGCLSYIQQQQHHGYCCHLLALLNALVYFGEPVPAQGVQWLQLLAVTKCRYCSPELRLIREAAGLLGLRMTAISLDLKTVERNVPAMLLIHVRNDLNHAALVVETDGDWLSLANYRGLHGDSRVDVRKWTDLDLCGDTAYAITRE